MAFLTLALVIGPPSPSSGSLPLLWSCPHHLSSCRDNHGHPFSLLFQDYQSFSSCRDNHDHMLSLLFQDYQTLLPCEDYQCFLLFTFSKTIRVFCFKDYQSLLSRLQCPLYFARLHGLSWIYLLPLILSHLTGFTGWAPASGQSDGEIARTKLMSLSLHL